MPPSESVSQARPRSYASFYGYGYDAGGEEGSLRRFEERARGTKGARPLEVGYDGNMGLVCHSAPGEMKGPVPDIPTTYILPPGTKRVRWEVCSGMVMKEILTAGFRPELKRSLLTLSSPRGWSGVMCRIIAEP
jgi:hypothetical protein